MSKILTKIFQNISFQGNENNSNTKVCELDRNIDHCADDEQTGDVVRDALGHHALSSHAGGVLEGKWGNGKRETRVSVKGRIRVGGRGGGDG